MGHSGCESTIKFKGALLSNDIIDVKFRSDMIRVFLNFIWYCLSSSMYFGRDPIYGYVPGLKDTHLATKHRRDAL